MVLFISMETYLHRPRVCEGCRKGTFKMDSLVVLSVECRGSASMGKRPLTTRHCLAWKAPVKLHRSLLVVSLGTTTHSTGMVGRYLAIKRAARPEDVKTTRTEALTLVAARTAADAIASRCCIGSGMSLSTLLK